jgi:hypothetical protein
MNTEKLRGLIGQLDLQTDLWWLATLLSGLMSTVLAAIAFPDHGVFWAYATVMVQLSIIVCLSQQAWGAIFGRLLALGLATGAFEIFADYLLVSWGRPHSGQRVYPAASALFLKSPAYVPLGWACAIVVLGYPILRIYGAVSKRITGDAGLGMTMVAGGFLSALVTACTEFLAVRAEWWQYDGGNLLGESYAFYIIMATFFSFFAFLPIFVRYVSCAGTRLYASIRFGVIYAALIFLSFALSHFLIERRI